MGTNIALKGQTVNTYYNHYENKYKTNTIMDPIRSSLMTDNGFRNPSKSFLHTNLQLNNIDSNQSSTLENYTITNPP